MSNKKPIITICSSANFYQQVVELEPQLEALGFEVIIPVSARKMKAANDFDAAKSRSWLTNPNDYHMKTSFIRNHFNEVAKADAILVLNNEKHGRPGYIGGNVLMEMAIAFHLNIPIFVYNPADPESSFLEEIIGMGSIFIDGDLHKIQI